MTEHRRAHRWVNAIIEVVVPLDDVTADSSQEEKLGAAVLLHDDLRDKLGPQWEDVVTAVRVEDASESDTIRHWPDGEFCPNCGENVSDMNHRGAPCG